MSLKYEPFSEPLHISAPPLACFGGGCARGQTLAVSGDTTTDIAAINERKNGFPGLRHDEVVVAADGKVDVRLPGKGRQ